MKPWIFMLLKFFILAEKKQNLLKKIYQKKTGIDKSYISIIENGLVQPTVGTFLKLLNAMGLRFDVGKIA